MTTHTASAVSCFAINFSIAGADAAIRRGLPAVAKEPVHLFQDRIWNEIAKSVPLASLNVLNSLLPGGPKESVIE